MGKVFEYIKILRPGNCLIASIAVFIGFAVGNSGFGFSFPLLLAMVSAFVICGAGQAINDYFDKEIDKKIRPEKAIPSKKIKARNVFLYSAVLFLAGIIISFFINQDAFTIALAFSVLLFVYSSLMQKIKFVGNLVVASGTGFTLIFGASVAGDYSLILPLVLSAFLVNVGREITKDMEDIEADKGIKKTLPMLLSTTLVKTIIMLCYAGGIMIALLAWFYGIIPGLLYLALVAVSGMGFSYSFYLLNKEKTTESHKFSKYAMIIALVAFASSVI